MKDERKNKILDNFINWASEVINDNEELVRMLHKSIGLTRNEIAEFDIEDVSNHFEVMYPSISKCVDAKILYDNLAPTELEFIEKVISEYGRGDIDLIIPRFENKEINFNGDWSVEIKDGSDKGTEAEVVVLKWYEGYQDTGYMMEYIADECSHFNNYRINTDERYSPEVSANIAHAQKAKQHCTAIKDGINGLCDCLDMRTEPFNESTRLVTYKAVFKKADEWERQYDDYIYEQKESVAIAACMKHKFHVTDFLDETVSVYPRLGLYEVEDFMGNTMHIPKLQLYTEDGEPFATLTKSFGEFIGAKNCAYIDTNNCPFAKQLLQIGIAKDTGLTKASGFCTYPLWEFKEEFLKDIGGEKYEQYSKEFDSYMGYEDEEESESDAFEQTM